MRPRPQKRSATEQVADIFSKASDLDLPTIPGLEDMQIKIREAKSKADTGHFSRSIFDKIKKNISNKIIDGKRVGNVDILIVEDDEVDFKSVKSKLKTDLNIRYAQTVSEGMKELQANQLILAVFDLNLPDGSGIELIQYAGRCRIPCVVFSDGLDLVDAHTMGVLAEFNVPMFGKEHGLTCLINYISAKVASKSA